MEAGKSLKIVAVFPEPTPYRAPLLDMVSCNPGIDLVVAYAARTVASRTWHVEVNHRAVYLRGRTMPGARRILRHDYPITPGVFRLLHREKPDLVVSSGWSTFSSQAAIAWCRLRHVPYVVVAESHDRDPRATWRRAVKGAVVPWVVRGAAGVLVTGTLARESMIRRGADPKRIQVFANTVDIERYVQRSDDLRSRRDELRRELELGPGDVAVLCVARLAAEKGLDTLLRAVAAAGAPNVPVFVGDGPERAQLEQLANELGLRAVSLGDVPWEQVVEAYSACDVFALLSRHEPWGVVVNEAAACALPLVLSEHVGAAHDLLRPGENGMLVRPDDVAATAEALRQLANDPGLRNRFGARSREIAGGWGYAASVQGFVELLDDIRAAG